MAAAEHASAVLDKGSVPHDTGMGSHVGGSPAVPGLLWAYFGRAGRAGPGISAVLWAVCAPH